MRGFPEPGANGVETSLDGSRAVLRLSVEEDRDADAEQRRVHLTYAVAGFAGAILEKVSADIVDLTMIQQGFSHMLRRVHVDCKSSLW